MLSVREAAHDVSLEIQMLTEQARSGWPVFLDAKRLNVGDNFGAKRARKNVATFGPNYLFVVAGSTLLSLAFHPVALLAVLALGAVAFSLNGTRLSYGGRDLSKGERMCVFACIAAIVLFKWTDAGAALSLGAFVGSFASAMHAAAHTAGDDGGSIISE